MYHYTKIVNVVTCPPLNLGNLENGQISYNTLPLANGGYHVDTLASFMCINDTYNLFGFDASTCQASGTWNNGHPLCINQGKEISNVFAVIFIFPVFDLLFS